MKLIIVAMCVFVSAILLSDGRMAGAQSNTEAGKVEKISDQMLDRLCNKRILFGHKSVGYNILEGVQEIKGKDPRFQRLAVVEIKAGDTVTFEKPGIYHQPNGKNGFPKGKCDAFRRLLTENEVGNKVDIAFFKFCYVDFTPESSVPEIFNYYVETIESLKKMFPKLTISHVTVPLVAHRWGVRSIIRNVTKGDPANVKRNEFNSLLTAKYGTRGVIFDLAGVESTYPDGKRESFKEKGKEYYSLIRDYTDDGGHLNALGRHQAASEFVRVLGSIAK